MKAVQRSEIIRTLQRDLLGLEEAKRAEWGMASSGCSALDRLLPKDGFRRGSIVEWLARSPGSGAATLAMVAAGQACRDGGVLVVVDRHGDFFPPVAMALAVDGARMIVVRPRCERDERWALDQTLRCPAVAVVWARVARLDPHDCRRFQVAAESSGALGLLVRPASVRGCPSWADVQLLVQPLSGAEHRRLRVEIVRCRGGTTGKTIEMELDETTGEVRGVDHDAATHPVPMVSQLADPTPLQRSTGA